MMTTAEDRTTDRLEQTAAAPLRPERTPAFSAVRLAHEFGAALHPVIGRPGRAEVRLHGVTISTGNVQPGEHMAGNLAVAIVMLLESGHDFDELALALSSAELPPVSGRTENVAGEGAPAVYVDFGHSPEAFRRTLETVRSITPGRVLTVFGADGDRDASKRADMAAEAVRGSDVLIITDHHPRFEDPASIRGALARAALGARPDAELHVVSPPPSAIRLAVSLAEAGDAILWAGPGHQDYRDVRGVRTPYSARTEARAALRAAGYRVR